ncbi:MULTISPECIES: DUF4978 domain-containing protein [unclassified Carboxylicivirga]|uniref:DUF4978 domain-containing protein n=1 Tax=Carboxylicivirga TaxID=1628153 RepID=UPI003D34DB08
MEKVLYYSLMLSFLLSSCGQPAKKETTIGQPRLVSQLVTNELGKTYLEVEGEPFFYNGVQAWLPQDGNYEVFMQKAHEVGYQIFTFWFPWRSIEANKGEYNWTVLNDMIEMAEKYDMRLDIVWGGSNFCGGLDKRFAPDFIMDNPDFAVKDEYGRIKYVKKFDMGLCPVADYSSQKLLAIEQETVKAFMDYLLKRDTTNRVVFFQVENEVNLFDFSLQDKKVVLDYCDRIGQVVKEAPYRIATRMNLAGKSYEPLIDSLQFIDCQGVDIYTDEIEILDRSINYKTRMPHVAENAAYDNSSTLMARAFAQGGFYNIYRLDYDYVWKKPGVYGDDWIYLPQTFDIGMLNKGLNKIAAQVAQASPELMVTFNTETKMPQAKYEVFKILGNHEIGYRSSAKWNEEGIGFTLLYDNKLYVVSDNDCTFLFKEPIEAVAGQFIKNEWKTGFKLDTSLKNGLYEISYTKGDCVQISF